MADTARESAAWAIARQRVGKEPVHDLDVTPLVHPHRADVVQRAVLAELEQGTPERIVRRAVLSLEAVTPHALRLRCARVSTAEQDIRAQIRRAGATRTRPRISSFDRIAGLVDTDPARALSVMEDPALVLNADERIVLADEARRLLALRGEA